MNLNIKINKLWETKWVNISLGIIRYLKWQKNGRKFIAI